MSEPFLAEIKIFGFGFAPRGWALCSGQIISISQNTALFSLLGTTYGGNGQTTFALPNFGGRVGMHAGSSQGPGLTPRDLGEVAGTTTVTLTSAQMPAHNHALVGVDAVGTQTASSNNLLAKGQSGNPVSGVRQARAYSGAAATATLAPNAMTLAGSGLPHNNMMPYLTMNYCIAMEGIFPARN